MLQNENVESEFTHNYKGANPSAFHDIEDVGLRAINRGAIMANIFERHTTKSPTGASQLLAKDFSLMARELDIYLEKVPKNERGAARDAMTAHLNKRGYNES